MKRGKSYVGIQNSSKVSCHLSSAIQLLYHAIDEHDIGSFIRISRLLLSRKILELGDTQLSRDVDIIIHLGDIFNLISSQQMKNENADEKQYIDPSNFYDSISNKLDSSMPGDATSSLRVLLKLLNQSISYLCTNANLCIDNSDEQERLKIEVESLKRSLSTKLWKGIVTHQLIGSKLIVSEGHHKQIIRSKPVKERQLPCIITLPMKKCGANDVIDAFNDVFSKPQFINGYNWNDLNENEYSEEVILLDEGDEIETKQDEDVLIENLDNQMNIANTEDFLKEDVSSVESSSSLSSSSSESSYSSTSSSSTNIEEWKSEKRTWISSVPTHLIFHIKRFEYCGGKVQNISNTMNIPMDFSLCNSVARSTCCCLGIKKCLKYTLTGAIVYNDDNSGENTIGDIGHYLCYFKMNNLENDDIKELYQDWLKIDDEIVVPFSVSEGTATTSSSGNEIRKTITQDQLLTLFGGTRTKSGYWSAFILLYNTC